MLQWSHVFSDMVREADPGQGLRAVRLQWSHVFSDMVSTLLENLIHFPNRLQWSHVFSDMVSTVTISRAPLVTTASMEPCLFRHGKMRLHSILQRMKI